PGLTPGPQNSQVRAWGRNGCAATAGPLKRLRPDDALRQFGMRNGVRRLAWSRCAMDRQNNGADRAALASPGALFCQCGSRCGSQMLGAALGVGPPGFWVEY